MAGIVGIEGAGGEEWVRRALNTIAHRGGSGETVRTLEGSSIGQIWPSVQDYVASGSEGTAVALDGEIQNWTSISVGGGDSDGFLQRQDIFHLGVVGLGIQKALFDCTRIAKHVVHAISEKLLDDGVTSCFLHGHSLAV